MNRKLFFDIGISQINKHGEELCGDTIITSQHDTSSTVILSDGLGSGVKANILSTLTSKILSVMIENGCPMEEVVETLIDTLPTCSVRQLAYSTFSFGRFAADGMVHLVEYDNPPAIFLRNGSIVPITYHEHLIQNKIIKEQKLEIRNGDVFVLLSDGEVHAGMGGMCNLGWGWDNIAEFAQRISNTAMNAREIAYELTNVAYQLYGGKPGDDTSVAVVRVRYKRKAAVMVGAPLHKEDDARTVQRFMKLEGRKIVCGGTTGNILCRELNRNVEVDFSTLVDGIPPIGIIPGIDLCTEGIITISHALRVLKNPPSYKRLEMKKDGVNRLVRELLRADDITLLVGRSMNAAHKQKNMPTEFGLKTQIMEKIGELLRAMGKQVLIEYY